MSTPSAALPYVGGGARITGRRPPGVVYVLALLIAFFAVFAPGFFTLSNLLNVSRQAAVLLILALGQTMIILTEGIDLSSGAVMGLAGVACALAVVGGVNTPLAILLGLAVGIAAGALNGVLITLGRLPPFIATLGMMGLAEGAGLALTQGSSVPGISPGIRYLGGASALGIPMPVWVAGLAFAWVWLVCSHTPFGIHVLALGGNREAARAVGIRVRKQEIRVYLLGGFLAAAAGIVLIGRMNSAHPSVGIGYEFDAIAATVLGGTFFEGGRGGIHRTLLGVALIAALRNGLNVIGLATYLQLAVVGSILVAALVLDTWLMRRARS